MHTCTRQAHAKERWLWVDVGVITIMPKSLRRLRALAADGTIAYATLDPASPSGARPAALQLRDCDHFVVLSKVGHVEDPTLGHEEQSKLGLEGLSTVGHP